MLAKAHKLQETVTEILYEDVFLCVCNKFTKLAACDHKLTLNLGIICMLYSMFN